MSFGSTMLGVVILLGAVALIVYLVTSKKDTAVAPAVITLTPASDELTPVSQDMEPVVVANELRTSSRPLGNDSTTRSMNNQGYLNSPRAWSAHINSAGVVWYQMDTGKLTTIYGVAIQGRQDADEWVTSFTVKYIENGQLKSVDKNTVFVGNTDRDTVKKVMFTTPFEARYIRIYPKTYTGHMSLRAGLLIKEESNYDVTELKLLNIDGSRRNVSSWWQNMEQHDAAHGILNSPTAWVSGEGSIGQNQWYEFALTGVTKVAGVAVQGRDEDGEQWITEFIVKYKKFSDDTSWQTVNGGNKMYGPGDNNSVVWSIFDSPIDASIIRIIPITWNSFVAGRFDLLASTKVSTTETYVIRGYSNRDD